MSWIFLHLLNINCDHLLNSTPVSSHKLLSNGKIIVKKFNYWIILVIITYGFTELITYGGLFLLEKYRQIKYEPVDVISTRHADIINNFIEQKTNYVTFSPNLGWAIKRNGSSKLYRANSSGIRSDKEYALTPRRGVLRISAFGDSFTHCDGVSNNETWQSIMESYDSNMEVINFGVSAYGTDQAYLRYLEEGGQYKSHIVLIGFMTENIYRNVNTYRPFYFPETGLPLSKPRFVIKDGKLSLIRNRMQSLHDYKMLLLYPQDVLSEIGINDYYFQNRYKSNKFDWSPTVRVVKILAQEVKKKLRNQDIIVNDRYNENSEAFRVTKKIFDVFYNASINNQSMPIILIFPNRNAVIRYHRQKRKRYSTLLSYFKSTGYKYIDLMDAFENTDVKDLFVAVHYSPFANKLVAKYIFNRLNNISNQESR